MIHISAPGKLFISGEWAILDLGNCGLVAAVDKRVHAKIDALSGYPGISINIRDFNLNDIRAKFLNNELTFFTPVDGIKDKLEFIKGAIETGLRYAAEHGKNAKSFKIETWGEMSQIGDKKIGFGSSAASVVAVIAAVLKFHDIEFDKEDLFKLATIAHYFVQGKVGSAFDVAASTYGGLFVYSRFDANWLVKEMGAGKPLNDIVYDEWPGLYVEELEIPKDFMLLVGWTGDSASTTAMVKQLNAWAEQNKEEHKRLYREIALTAEDAIEALKNENKKQFIELIQKNEMLLRELGEKSGVNIETLELRKLSELAHQCGGCGKLSGAGGGDCGIGICFDAATTEKIKDAWSSAGLTVVDADIDTEGFVEY